MKRSGIYLWCLLSLLSIFHSRALASHAAGGELSYEWVSDSTYRVYFKFYRDCTGAGAAGTMPLCYRNSCNSGGGQVTLYALTKLPDSTLNGSPVSEGCPGVGTKCTNSSSIVPGYREYWYTNTVTLPSRCSLWTFSIAFAARNPSYNLSGGNGNVFYIEATLNNQVAQGNSSPFFSVKPVPSVCINKSYTYNNGAVDPNSDSLTFEMLQPAASNLNCPRTTAAISFTSASPSYNLTNNPIQTGNSFHLDSSTGQMTFTPTQTGAGTLTIRVKEYRNGVLIGTVMRDVQVQVIACSVTSPIVNTVSGSISGATYTNGRVEACAGVALSFCYDLKSSDTAAIIVASDNHSAAAPGSSVNYIGQKTDSVRGCLTWTPGSLDTGLRVFSVTAKDSTCVSPGVSVSQTFVLPIYIWPVTDIIKDTTICIGDSVQLLAVGGSAFTWSVLPGGSPLTSLSCTTCKQPYAKPTIYTRYIVNNSGASYCSKNSDTVTVNVRNYTAIAPVAGGITPACSGDTIFLTASLPSGFGFSWTGPASFTSTAQNPVRPNAQLSHSGNYILKGTRDGCYTAADTVAITVNQTPSTPVAFSNSPVCAGTQLNLNASTITGATYNWTGPNSYTSNTQNPSITNTQLSDSGTYYVSVAANGCESQSASVVVVVKPTPEIDTYAFINPTTCLGTDGKIILTGLDTNTTYNVNYKKNGTSVSPVLIASASTTDTLIIAGLSAGTYSAITLTLNGCTSDTTEAIILSDPTPPSISLVDSTNPATCLANDGDFTIGGLTPGLVYTVNYKKGGTPQAPEVLTADTAGEIVIDTLTAGSYSDITVTINNCISNSVAVVLSDPAPPVISSSNNGPLCPGDTIKLFATGPPGVTYSWTGPNSFTSASQDTIILNAATTHSGNYIVTGVLNNCMSEPDTTVVTVNPTPSTPVAGNNGPLCTGETLNLSVETITGATYEWTGPNSFTSSFQYPSKTDVDTSYNGTYTVVATVAGCVSLPGTTNVIVYLVPQIDTYTYSHPTTCIGTEGSIKLTGLISNTTYTVDYRRNGVAQIPLSLSTGASSDTLVINNLGSGTYSQITVTLNGCTSDTTGIIILSDPLPPVISLSDSTDPSTCFGTDGDFTISGLTPGLSYTVNYKKGGSSQMPQVLTADTSGEIIIDTLTEGNYSEITVSINNCTSNSLAVVLSDPAPPVISSSNNGPLCPGDTIKLFASGPPGTVYSWTGPNSFTSAAEDTIIINATTAHSGDYIVTGVLYNCTSEPDTTAVLVNPTPATPVANNNGPLCAPAALHLTTAAVTNATYYWEGPNSFTSSLQNPVVNNADTADSGTYAVTVIVDGCASLPGSTSVAIYQVPEIDTYLYSHPATCSGTEGTIKLTGLISNTTYTINYRKDGIAQTPVSFATGTTSDTLTITGLGAGVYSAITVSLNGCTSDTTGAIILIDPTPPSISLADSTNLVTCSGNEGNIIIGGLDSGITYTVNFKKEGNPQAPRNLIADSAGKIILDTLAAGTYDNITVTVNNCTSNAVGPVVLSDPAPPVVVAGNNTPICEGDTIKLFASGPPGTVYSWTGPNTFTSSVQDTIIINAVSTQSGGYIVTGVLNNCTSEPDTTIVMVKPTPPSPVAGNNGPLCSPATLYLTATTVTNATYNWEGPGSFTSTVQNPVVNNADTADSGTYTVIAIVDGCPSLPANTQVIINLTPVIDTYTISGPTTCLGSDGNIKLTGLISGVTYTVNYDKNGSDQVPFSLTASSSGDVTIGNLTAGTYDSISVTVNSCTSNLVGPLILADPLPPVISSGNNTPVCQGDTVKLFANGPVGTSYSWTGPSSFISGAKDTIITNSLPVHSGNYIVTGTLNNCTSEPDTTVVTVKPTPATPVANNNGPLCSGNTLNLTSTTVTGATYSWTGPNSFTSGLQNPLVNNVDTADSGTYVVVAIVDGCSSLPDSTQVSVFMTPEIDTHTIINPTTCLGADGIIQLKGLLYNETYAVNYYKDGNPQATATLTSDGTGILQISGLTAGTYSKVTVLINGCSSDTTDPIILTDPLPPVISGLTSTDPSTCLGTEGTITLAGLDAGKTYTVNYTKNGIAQAPANLIANGAGNVVVNTLGAGIYDNINVTIDNCTSNSVGPDTLTDPLPPSIAANNNTPICEEDTLKLFASSVPGVVYNWSGPNSYTSNAKDTVIPNALPILSGTYAVTATINNCTSEPDTTIVIVHPTPPLPNAGNTGPYCTGNTIFLTADTITGASYYWSGPLSYTGTGQYPTVNSVTTANAGRYYVHVTVNGCLSPTDSTDVTIYPPLAPVIGSFAVTHPTTCGGTDGSITLSGLTPDSTYQVTYRKNGLLQAPLNITANASGKITITSLGQGTYDNIQVKLSICSSDPVGPVTLNDPLPPVVSVSSNSPVCEGDTLKLFASSVSGVTFNWSGPNGFTSLSKDTIIANVIPSQAGIYSVTGTLNNCTSSPFTTNVIIYPTPPTPVAANNGPLCPGDILVLTASAIANATYQWKGPNSFISNNQNPSINNVGTIHSGDYRVSVTVNGCRSDSDTTTVIVNPTPVIASKTTSNPTTCSGTDGSISLMGLLVNTSYTVNYRKNGIGQTPQIIATDGTGKLIITGLGQGVYTRITVTLNGCVSDTLTPAYLSDPAPPVVNASNNSPICQDDTIKLFASGVAGITYSWTGPSSFTSTNKEPVIPNGQLVNAGVYAVTGTLYNCTSLPVTTTVVIKPKPAKPTAFNNGPLCEGSSLGLNASSIPSATYKWTGPNSYTSNAQNPTITNISPTQAGKYFVQSIVNGCYSNGDTTVVVVYPKPNAPVVVSPVLYCQFDTALPLTASGQNLLWYTASAGGTGNVTAPTPVTATPVSKTWWVSQTDANGCESPRATITVKVNAKPFKPVVANLSIVYCQLDNAVPLAAIGANLKWYTQATGGTGSSVAPTPSTANFGTFSWWVSQTDGNGCESDRAIITVTIKPKPAPPVVSNVFYCDGDIADALTANGQTLRWFTQPTGGTGSTTAPTPSTADTGTTDFYVSQSVDGCESDRAKITVKVSEHVTAGILTDGDSICQYDTLMLANDALNPANASYTWNFSGASVLSGTGPGPYLLAWDTTGIMNVKVVVTNSSCSDSDSRKITVHKAPGASFQLDDNACAGEVIELRPYWDYANVSEYLWFFEGGIIKDTTTYNTYNVYWPTPGTRNVTLITVGKNGCMSKPLIHPIIVHDKPDGRITGISNTDICSGDTVKLFATENNTNIYQWSPTGYFLLGNRGSEVTGVIARTGFVYVNITSLWGCTKTDSMYIYTKPCCEISLPDAFTPNNDGHNDKFRVITTGHHQVVTFIILNRWGQEVFRTGNELDGWDGTFKGIPQDMGNYNYYIKYKCSDDRVVEKKGEVTLIR